MWTSHIPLYLSYLFAAGAMTATGFYSVFRLRPFVNTTTMLLGLLLLIYGPAYLSFMLSSGERAFPIRHLLGVDPIGNATFSFIRNSVGDFNAVAVAMNLSVGIMFLGIMLGIELVNRLLPKSISRLQTALDGWRSQSLQDNVGVHRMLLLVILLVLAFMTTISISENHLLRIGEFFSISGVEHGGRIAYRLNQGGSADYPYRVVLNAIAPMLVIWGLLTGWLYRSGWLLFAAGLLFVATMVGRLETLSKAPPAFFLLQMLLGFILIFNNRMTGRAAIGLALVAVFVLFVVFRLFITSPDTGDLVIGTYSRVFEAESESLLENFAAFPFMHPHMWGANIRPLAWLMGVQFVPANHIVALIWHGTNEVTSPSLFIADAWADFSYEGVLAFSVIAGAACRAIDALFLARGKTAVGISVLCATFNGILSLMTTALNTAFFSGGLVLAPTLASLIVCLDRYFAHRSPT